MRQLCACFKRCACLRLLLYTVSLSNFSMSTARCILYFTVSKCHAHYCLTTINKQALSCALMSGTINKGAVSHALLSWTINKLRIVFQFESSQKPNALLTLEAEITSLGSLPLAKRCSQVHGFKYTFLVLPISCLIHCKKKIVSSFTISCLLSPTKGSVCSSYWFTS